MNHGSDGQQVALVGRSHPQHVPLVCRCLGQGEGAPQVRLATKPFIDIVSGVIIYLVLGVMGNISVCMHRLVSDVTSSYSHLPDQLNAVLLGWNGLIFLADLTEFF